MARLMSFNALKPLGAYKQRQLNNMWQGPLTSPDKPSLVYGHGTTPMKMLMTGQGQSNHHCSR